MDGHVDRVLGRFVLLAFGTAGLVVAQATLLVDLLVGAFVDRNNLPALAGPFALLAVVVAARAGVAVVAEWAGVPGSAPGRELVRLVLLTLVPAALGAIAVRLLSDGLDVRAVLLAVVLALEVARAWRRAATGGRQATPAGASSDAVSDSVSDAADLGVTRVGTGSARRS